METLAVVGTMSLGAYLITKATRNQTEAMDKVFGASTTDQLVADTRKADMDNAVLQPVKSILNKEAHLEDAYPALPDPERSQFTPQPTYWRASEERENYNKGEIGNVLQTGINAYNRYDEYDRLGTTNARDFRDANGDVPNSYSTGVLRPERMTADEARWSRITPEVNDSIQPHVRRTTRIDGRAVVQQPFWRSTVRSKPDGNCRRNLISWNRSFGVHSAFHPSEGRPQMADDRLTNDQSRFNNRTTTTPYYGKNMNPRIGEHIGTEIGGRLLYQPRITINPAATTKIGTNINNMQVRHVRKHIDSIMRASTSNGSAPAPFRQSVMQSRMKSQAETDTHRSGPSRHYRVVDSSTKAQEMHRRRGQRVETAAFMPLYNEYQFNHILDTNYGIKPEDSVSASVYNADFDEEF